MLRVFLTDEMILYGTGFPIFLHPDLGIVVHSEVVEGHDERSMMSPKPIRPDSTSTLLKKGTLGDL